jgi:hypothetical protein
MIYKRPLDEADNHQTKSLNSDFKMTKFEQVKNAVSNSIRFLSSKRDSILTLMLMLVWTCLLFLFNTPDHQSGMESQVQIICNDKSYINHPMASEQRIDWKGATLIFGPIFTCLNFVIIAILHGIAAAGRTKNTNFSKWKFFYRSLLWILSLLTGVVLAWLWSSNRFYSETRLAPNFLAACRPLDLSCSPDSIVRVECTTPAEIWMPALSDSLPTSAAITAYLMVISFVKMVHVFWVLWVMDKTAIGLVLGLIPLGLSVAFTLATGCMITTCNDASFNIVVSGYIKSFMLAWIWLVGEHYWSRQSEIEDPKLPRHWNDVPDKKVKPGKGSGKGPTSTNPTPSQHEPPATTNATIYPNLPPK